MNSFCRASLPMRPLSQGIAGRPGRSALQPTRFMPSRSDTGGSFGKNFRVPRRACAGADCSFESQRGRCPPRVIRASSGFPHVHRSVLGRAMCERALSSRQIRRVQEQHLCTCGKPLLARYDLRRAAATLTLKSLQSRLRTLWRYAEVLPNDSAGIAWGRHDRVGACGAAGGGNSL